MSRSLTKVVGIALLSAAAGAFAGPLGYFQVIGHGTSQGQATTNAYAAAAAICAGRGSTVADSEIIDVEQMGSTWRALLRARCN